MYTKKLNKRLKKSWALCVDYLAYRKDGGKLSPLEWNERQIELNGSYHGKK